MISWNFGTLVKNTANSLCLHTTKEEDARLRAAAEPAHAPADCKAGSGTQKEFLLTQLAHLGRQSREGLQAHCRRVWGEPGTTSGVLTNDALLFLACLWGSSGGRGAKSGRLHPISIHLGLSPGSSFLLMQ